MSDLRKLKCKRGLLKAALTRQRTYLNNFSREAIENKHIVELETRLNAIEPILHQYNEIQLEIDELSCENDSDEIIIDFHEIEEFENLYLSIKSDIKALIESFNSFNIQDTATNEQSIYKNNSQQRIVQLPTIKLPTYDGNYSNWSEFRDSFQTLIHENVTLSNIQKFQYLRSALEKEALHVIESIQVSNTNYTIAWQILQERFEQKNLLTFNHTRALFDTPCLNTENHSSLRNLHDTMTKHLRALNNLGEPTDKWDTLIIYLITSKLDRTTRREWELFEIAGETATMNDMNKFLNHRCNVLEKIEIMTKGSVTNSKVNTLKNKTFKHSQSQSYVSTDNLKCYYCKGNHTIFKCEVFLKKTPRERVNEVKSKNLCYNCLRPTHAVQICKHSSCKICGKRHNSLLHIKETKFSSKPEEDTDHNLLVSASNNNEQASKTLHSVSDNRVQTTQVLLSTALIYISDINGKLHQCRALLDCGSQSSFITETLCKRLRLNLEPINHSIVGIGQAMSNLNHRVNLQVFSNDTNYNTTITSLVISKITGNIPAITFDKCNLDIPKNIWLADPNFNKTDSIDILIGSAIFWQLLQPEQIEIHNSNAILQKTRLGWLIGGTITSHMPQLNESFSNFTSIVEHDVPLDNQLKRFWEIEEIAKISQYSQSEQFCELHFSETHQRDGNGQFIVSIPFKDNINLLGESKDLAMQRFLALERKLLKYPNLRQEYNKFMNEYEQLGHMTEIKNDKSSNTTSYYMPHHAVIREQSRTTKLRVVFDGSMKTSSGLSINDTQHVGPVIQDNLFSILLRFRKHKFVMTADISKMYRMISVHHHQRHLQRIFWRNDPSEDLKIFQLNTVTYGTASAPYLAVRCLQQLGIENQLDYPIACERIKHDFYVDDLLTGSDNAQELLQLQEQITNILSAAGFQLRKWLCNHSELGKEFHVYENLEESILTIEENETNKTLGILWNANLDTIEYSVSAMNNFSKLSKRTILSTISQIYDPLGLLGPLIIVAKILIQRLWQINLAWDDAIPNNLRTEWWQFYKELSELNDLKIPRCVVAEKPMSLELHGFSDASEKAYGACIYVRSQDQSGKYSAMLLCAKSRVAPVKQITLPRLELCGALLLAQLSRTVTKSIKMDFDNEFFWSDSKITLAWIRGEPNRWKTFVANRVSEIQQLTNVKNWHHVESQHNPADLLSRGTNLDNLKGSDLWWKGPNWLEDNNLQYHLKENTTPRDNLPEQKTITAMSINNEFAVTSRFSSLQRLKRVIAYCLRFISNARERDNVRKFQPLSATELERAMLKVIQLMQLESFKEEHERLKNNLTIKTTSKLMSLNPFIDSAGIIRVGGRLQNSNGNYENKHPILLCNKHPLTKLIFNNEHKRLLHCGPTMLLFSIRERYWPISGRNLAKQTTRNCVTCFKAKPKSIEYLRGNLPEKRVNQYLPFYNVGCDFAGPLQIKDRSTRNPKLIKAYVCLFVCFTTKAIHLEPLSDLTTSCFISTLKRFVSRRGKPLNVFSDNGKTFIGADAELTRVFKFVHSQVKVTECQNYLSDQNITWNFIPARSPTFGGLWEAGIKSFKFHFKRVVGKAHLSFEDLTTVLAQIEAILNSRPLYPLTLSPDELNPLTPAHFLVGRTLTSLPESCYLENKETSLRRYERLQQIVQQFWARWHREYLCELQSRTKWKQEKPSSLAPGTLVLLREDKSPPLYWPMGRVHELHPGSDGVVRVVSVKVNKGIVKRAVTKLCIFPVN